MNKINKNVVFVTNLHLWSLEKGKGGKAFYHTVHGYLNAGWNVSLISTGGSIPDEISTQATVIEKKFIKLQYLQEHGLKLISIASRFIKMWLMNRFFINEASKILNSLDLKSTVIYAYEVEAVFAARKIANRFKIPLVTRFQGTVLADVPNNWLNRLRRSPHFSALKTTADLVIMTNDGTQGNKTLNRLGNKSHKIRFWRNGVDSMENSQSFSRNEVRNKWGIPLNGLIFITVSRLIAWKRVHLAIDGFAKVSSKFQECYLIIVGDGPERANLEAQAAAENLNSRVIFLGSIEQAEVKRLLGASDIFLSLYDLSNLGNPIMEAMMVGLPLITIDVGDTAELIENGINGILIEKNEIVRIPSEMERLIIDSDFRQKIAEGALQTAKKEFWTWGERVQTEIDNVDLLLDERVIIND